MNTVKTTAGDHGWQRKQMIEYATFTPEDKAQIVQCRGTHNRLGFAYQIAFARLMNRFPAQQPLEIIQGVLDFVGVQLGLRQAKLSSMLNEGGTQAKRNSDHIRYAGGAIWYTGSGGIGDRSDTEGF